MYSLIFPQESEADQRGEKTARSSSLETITMRAQK